MISSEADIRYQQCVYTLMDNIADADIRAAISSAMGKSPLLLLLLRAVQSKLQTQNQHLQNPPPNS